jgi:hypothetical protein
MIEDETSTWCENFVVVCVCGPVGLLEVMQLCSIVRFKAEPR